MRSTQKDQVLPTDNDLGKVEGKEPELVYDEYQLDKDPGTVWVLEPDLMIRGGPYT